MYEQALDLFTTVLPLLPEAVLSTVGGFALIATRFAKPQSQWGRFIYAAVNILGANFGKAKNK